MCVHAFGSFGGGARGVEVECNKSQWEREGGRYSPTGKHSDKKNGKRFPPRKSKSKTQKESIQRLPSVHEFLREETGRDIPVCLHLEARRR